MSATTTADRANRVAQRISATTDATVSPNRMSSRKRWANIGFSAIAVVIFFFSAFPVYWMLSSSFMVTGKIRASTPTWFPWGDAFTTENYRSAMFDDHRAQFLPALWNSVQVTFLTLIICLVVAFLASVAVGRFFFKGRKAFIVAILIIQMIPGEAMMITLFRMMDGWHLTENIFGLMLIYLSTVLPFTIWTLRGFVNAVPAELEESAMVDGCSRAQAFWKVTFPLLAPGLVSTGVFSFIQAWNEFNMALIMMTLPDNMTLPVWLRTFLLAEHGQSDWGGLMAGSTLTAVPVVIFFLIVQGRMTGGLTAGAVKG